jgi:subtilisin family serine protease
VAGLRGPTSAAPGSGWLDKSQTTGDELWAGSLTGPQTILTAPAVDLLGARPGGYWRVQGTSFAAPLVTGAAALVRSKYPGLSAANVINRLIRTAEDLGPAGRDDRYGYGLVNPLAALTAEVDTVTGNPLLGAPETAGQAGAATDGGGGPTTSSTHAGPATGATPDAAPGGAPALDGESPHAQPGHRRAGAIVNSASAGSSVALLALLLAAILGSLAGGHRYAQRYLRQPRHGR